ncbi:MAG: hypothetical protein PVI15_08190 [Chromatiales bacterium]|jgi:hypothetical protein
MQAPVYPPATEFKQPEPAPFEFGIDTVMVEELISSPSIKQMLERDIPNFSRAIQSPMLKPHLSNFTLRSLVDFGIVSDDLLEVIDTKLRSWPVDERPKL